MASQPYLGAIFLFAGNFAPRGYQFCAGQLLSIEQYSALFSILGTTYGGNGQTTFGLPDLRCRVAVGAGNGPGLTAIAEGELAGTENVSILISNMPGHNHLINAVSGAGTQSTPANNFPAALAVTHPVPDFPTTTAFASSGANATMAPTTVSVTGSGIPISIRNPYLGLNYIICISGLYPSRS